MHRLAAILALMIVGHAAAQRPVLSPAQSNVPQQPPRRVDQAVADVNALSTSLRVIDPGLRQPGGFRELMEVPGRPDLLMRANGEVYAVFPRSVYAAVRGGIMPVIPANTIFYIGTPPSTAEVNRAFPAAMNERTAQPSGAPLIARRQGKINSVSADSHFDDRPARSNEHAAPPPAADPDAPDTRMIYDMVGPVTIVTDHSYRLWRLQELLQRAAKAEQARSTAENHP